MSSARAQEVALQQYITDTVRDLQKLQTFMKKREESLNILLSTEDRLNVLQSAEEEMDRIRRNDPRSTSEAWINYLCCSGPWSKDGGEQSWLCCCSSCSCCCGLCVYEWGSCVCCSNECVCCSCTCTSLEEIEKKLRERLNKALKNVQQQLDELKPPLLAIERLAVTSERVFQQDLQAQVDLRGVDLRAVRRVLSLVKAVSPWVIVFKQDQIFKLTLKNISPSEENNYPQLNRADIPLLPRSAATAQRDTLGNTPETIEPLQLRLQAFISALKNICRLLQDRSLMELHLNQAEVRLSAELSEERADMIQKLQEIRENADSRLVFLLGDQAQTFTEELREREPQMNKCLKEVLERAEKLEPACRGKADEGRGSNEEGAGEERGSNEEGAGEGRSCFCSLMIAAWWCFSRIIRAGGGVVCSLVGIAASVASLVGLSVRSVPLEVSTIWLLSGLILSSISLVINLLTMSIDKSVNKCQKLKGDDICEQVKGHRKVLQRCLDSATFSPTEKIPEEDQTLAGGKIGFYCLRFGLKIVDIIGDFFTFEEVKSITKGTFLWSVIANTILLVWELVSIIYRFWVWCKGTGKPPVGAQWLKVRAALWKADMEDWKKICESLKRGQPRAERNKQLLNTAFY